MNSGTAGACERTHHHVLGDTKNRGDDHENKCWRAPGSDHLARLDRCSLCLFPIVPKHWIVRGFEGDTSCLPSEGRSVFEMGGSSPIQQTKTILLFVHDKKREQRKTKCTHECSFTRLTTSALEPLEVEAESPEALLADLNGVKRKRQDMEWRDTDTRNGAMITPSRHRRPTYDAKKCCRIMPKNAFTRCD